MNTKEYIKQKKDLYHNIIEFFDDENENKIYFNTKLQNCLDEIKQLENKEEIKLFCGLILELSNNHHTTPSFHRRMNQILIYLKDQIKQSLTNSEIFNLFKDNKRILLFLFQNQCITIDDKIFVFLNSSDSHRSFFYPEIKSFIKDEDEKKNIEKDFDKDFEEKRQIGENDSFICSLIRNDSIEDFVSYVNKHNIYIDSRIKRSYFETNQFLIENDPTLIEYSVFFGSIQIYQYLQLNKANLDQSLWLYAIHGRNPEIIHMLEQFHLIPKNSKFYNNCYIEAIKCHHNEIANYIKENYLNPKTNQNKFIENCIRYFNYEYFPNDFNPNDDFVLLLGYNFYTLVDFFLDKKKRKIEKEISVYKYIIYL